MTYQTTVGWSLLSSGVVTLLLAYLPGDSVWWGVGLQSSALQCCSTARCSRADDVRRQPRKLQAKEPEVRTGGTG